MGPRSEERYEVEKKDKGFVAEAGRENHIRGLSEELPGWTSPPPHSSSSSPRQPSSPRYHIIDDASSRR